MPTVVAKITKGAVFSGIVNAADLDPQSVAGYLKSDGSAVSIATINLDDLADVSVASPTDQYLLYWDAATSLWKCRALVDGDIPAAIKTLTITFIIDGGGSAITTGEKGHLEIPFACTIKQATMLADASGSIVVDIWKDTYANFPPTDADSITASAPPTISSAQKSQDATLTGWTKTIAAGNILAFNVDSCTTIKRVTISLKVERS